MTQTTWVAELTIATPEPLTEDLLNTLDEEGEERDWYVTPRADGPGMRIAVYALAPSPIDIAKHAASEVDPWLEKHGVQGETIEMRVVTEEQREAEAQAPTMPPLVSASGAAGILGVKRQRVHQLAQTHPKFPAPLVKLATGPVWDERAIEWFKSVWERKPGRPPRMSSGEVREHNRTMRRVTVNKVGQFITAKSTRGTKPDYRLAAKSTRSNMMSRFTR